MKDADPEVRKTAAESLGNYPFFIRDTVPPLLAMLSDSHDEVRWAVIKTLSKVGRKVPEVVDAFQVLLSDPDDQTVMRAAVAVALTGRMDAELVPGLKTALQYEWTPETDIAVTTLGKIALNTSEMFPDIITGLISENRFQQANTLRVIRHAKRNAEPLLPDLLQAYDNVDPANRALLLQTIVEIKPQADAVSPMFIKALNDKTPQVRRDALKWAGILIENTELFRQLVGIGLKDPDDEVVVSALRLFSNYGKQLEGFNETISQLSKSSNLTIKNSALAALGFSTDLSAESYSILGDASIDQNQQTRMAAVTALYHLGKQKSDSALPYLRAAWALESDNRTKEFIGSALYEFGEPITIIPAPSQPDEKLTPGWDLGRE